MDIATSRTKILFSLTLILAVGSFLLLRFAHAGTTAIYFLQSILLLTVIYLISVGADWMVDASVRLARRLGISYLAIGLTVVAVGTSAPELVASLLAGFQGEGNVSIANVVGSNIFNLCFILGGAALLTKGGIQIRRIVVWRDTLTVIGGTVLLFLFVGGFPSTGHPGTTGGWFDILNLRLDRAEGFAFLGGMIGYLFWLYRSRRQNEDAADPGAEAAKEADARRHAVGTDLGIFAVGLTLVLLGCRVLVGEWTGGTSGAGGYGALWFAHHLGLPDYVIGATIVAAGTSAPELVVSLTAAARGRGDIATGNLLGSTIFNIFGVLGVTGVVLQRPIAAPIVLSPDVTAALIGQCGLVVLIGLFMFTGRRLSRREGLILVLIGLAHWVIDFSVRGQL